MQGESFFLKHPLGAQLHYRKFGHGERILLAFHGFGQDHSYYQIMAELLGQKFTVFSFDLFYHGRSFWHHNETPLTKNFWKELMGQFLTDQKIEHFSLAGFSMGGKFVLGTLEAFPHSVEEVLFIAPDGIKTSMWYSLATYPGALQNLFRSFIVRPQGFVRLVEWMHRLKVVDKGILKFARTQMRTTKQRRRVFYSWTVFKPLQFDMKHIAGLINQHHIGVKMYLGKHDKIMTEQNMRKLLDRLEDYELHILDKGHNSLIRDTAVALAKHEEN